MLRLLRSDVVILRLLIIAALSLNLTTQLWGQAGTQQQGGLPVGQQDEKTQSIEDMFKNVARAKAERNQLESSDGAGAGQLRRGTFPTVRPSGDNAFRLRAAFPSQAVPKNVLRLRAAEPLSASPLGFRQAVVLRSLEFQDDLKRLDRQCASLAQLLRDDSQRNRVLKNVLPFANRLSSDVRMMLQATSAKSMTENSVAAYRGVDQGWRQLEFQLRGLGGLGGDTLEAVHDCDQLISRMSRQLGLLPQFDREQLHKLLLVLGTKLGTLSDDLRLADLDLRVRHSLEGTLRLLRQDTLNLVDRVDDLEQKDVVIGLNKLNAQWKKVAATLERIADVHVQHRVQDVAKCFGQAHGLLWIVLPPDADVLLAVGARLVAHCRLLVADLSQRLANADQLTGSEQIRLGAQSLLENSESLNDQISQGVPFASWKSSLMETQRSWSSLRVSLVSSGLVKRQMVLAIDSEFQRLDAGLGVQDDAGDAFDHKRLLRIAAAIESTAGFVDADLQRYRNLLSPLAFRDTTLSASSAFLQSAKLFHQLIDQQADAGTISSAAVALQDSWRRLLSGLSQIQLHGISALRAKNLLQDQRELVQYISEVSTVFSP